MRTWSLLLFVASFRFTLSKEDPDQDQTHRWIVPTQPGPSENFGGNLIWNQGSVAHLEWTSTLEEYKIDLYQQRLDRPAAYRIETILNTTTGAGNNKLEWTVQLYDSNTTFSPVYFFWLNPVSTKGRTSHYFNITDPIPSSSASSVSSTSSTVDVESTRTEASTSETSTSNPTSTSTSETSSASATSADSSTTSATTTRQDTAPTSDPEHTIIPTPSGIASDVTPAAGGTNTTDQTSFRVGLGVGLGLGIPLFLLIGAYVGLRLWRQWRTEFRKNNSSLSLAEINDTKHDPYRYASNDEPYYQHRDYRHEMSSSEPQLYEISGMGRKPSELAA